MPVVSECDSFPLAPPFHVSSPCVVCAKMALVIGQGDGALSTIHNGLGDAPLLITRIVAHGCPTNR